MPGIGFDRMREVGRGVRDTGTTAKELCGACGDGRVAINPDGEATVCVFAGFTESFATCAPRRCTSSPPPCRRPVAR